MSKISFTGVISKYFKPDKQNADTKKTIKEEKNDTQIDSELGASILAAVNKVMLQNPKKISLAELEKKCEGKGKITISLNDTEQVDKIQQDANEFLKCNEDEVMVDENKLEKCGIKDDLLSSYLKNLSSNIDEILQKEDIGEDKIEELLARKALYDVLASSIDEKTLHYKNVFTLDKSSLPMGLEESRYNSEHFISNIENAVKTFLDEGILSKEDFLKKQIDSDHVMETVKKNEDRRKEFLYNELFDPVYGLGDFLEPDPCLHKDNPEFYRIISKGELEALFETAETGERITANGHFTNGNYSCITTNKNYNEQAFEFNGTPIRLKFKTKDKDGLYRMDLFDRMAAYDSKRSIYRVYGYNFDDIDWNDIAIKKDGEWHSTSLQEIIEHPCLL